MSLIQKILLFIGFGFIIYSSIIVFLEPPVPPQFIAYLSMLSLLISILFLLRTLFKNAKGTTQKVLTVPIFIACSFLILIVHTLLFVDYEKNEIQLISNYATVVAFGVSLLSTMVEIGNNSSKNKTYIIKLNDGRTITKKFKL